MGLAVADGKLSIDDEVLKFFPDDAPKEPSKNLEGHAGERPLANVHRPPGGAARWRPEASGRRGSWPSPCRSSPALISCTTRPATYMLSAIVQKATGMTVLDYLRPRLFEPLGIENPTWGTSPQGISLGGYGLSIRTEDIARFGQLYLQKGKWQGKQLVPASWIEAATARQTSNGSNPKSDWDQGYGYQFWRCRHGAFRGDGAFGQFCVVLPEQDAVIAITSGVKDMQSVLNLVWDQLLPAMKSRATGHRPRSARETRRRSSPACRCVPRKGKARPKLRQESRARRMCSPPTTGSSNRSRSRATARAKL